MIYKNFFGKTESGELIESFTLENENGMKSVILNYGAILKELWVYDKNDVLGNVVLSYDDLSDYISNPLFLGAVIGRTAGRIEGGVLEIDGESFSHTDSNKFNSLHGGTTGFHQKVMKAICEENEIYSRLTLEFNSYDGEGGFPGALEVEVIYTMLRYENVLKFEIKAKSNKKTYLNVTNHSYFNLSSNNENIENHTLKLASDAYGPVDGDMIPRQGWKAVDGTVFDFRKGKLLKIVFDSNDDQIRNNLGIDHPFRLTKQSQNSVAQLFHKGSGRLIRVYTSQPHMVIYTGNFLDMGEVESGLSFKKHEGICFEAQEVPNALKFKGYRCKFLELNKEYNHSITYEFDIKNTP